MMLASLLYGIAALGLVSAQKSCPGYRASNVQQTANGVTANLNLAGTACNIYGSDLRNLTLTVEYQSGRWTDCQPI